MQFQIALLCGEALCQQSQSWRKVAAREQVMVLQSRFIQTSGSLTTPKTMFYFHRVKKMRKGEFLTLQTQIKNGGGVILLWQTFTERMLRPYAVYTFESQECDSRAGPRPRQVRPRPKAPPKNKNFLWKKGPTFHSKCPNFYKIIYIFFLKVVHFSYQ